MIRSLQINELKLLTPGAVEFWKEGNLPGDFIPHVFERNWSSFIQSGVGRIFASFSDGMVCGAIGIIISKDINDDSKTAEEAFWFVRPLFRRDGLRLFYRAEEYAKKSGCKRMCMVHLHSLKSEKISIFYEKNGFSVIEHKYQKIF